MPTNISTKGVKLSEKEIWELEKLSNEYEVKIARKIRQDTDNVTINIHIKAHEKEPEKKAKRQKYNVHVEVKTTSVFGSLGEDWDIATAIHKAMEKIISEIEHKFHSSDQHTKKR
jgi:uncharacterized protein (DUF2461 family)